MIFDIMALLIVKETANNDDDITGRKAMQAVEIRRILKNGMQLKNIRTCEGCFFFPRVRTLRFDKPINFHAASCNDSLPSK